VIDSANPRIASRTELWSILLKILAFDDPASKSQNLRKAARKHLDKRANFETMPMRQQVRLFTSIFGDQANIENAAICRLVNFVLAFEDLNRFSRIAFDTWTKPEWLAEPIDANVSKLNFELSSPEKLWMTSALLSAPAWTKIAQIEQGSDDPRVQLISEFIELLRKDAKQFSESNGTPHTDTLLKALETWRQLLKKHRSALPGSFLPKIILLVEGQTESLIVPTFAKLLGLDFNQMGAHVESCGGAKQVVKYFLNLKELTVLPIICVLDADVSESAEIINDGLREQDRMVTMRAGEIEDSFSLTTFHRLLNIYLKETGCLEPISFSELQTQAGERIEVLDRLFRIRGLGNFDKIGFAETAVRNLHKSDVPDDGKRIIGTIEEVYNAGIKLRFQ